MFSRAQWGYVDLFSAHSIATRCAGPGRGLITEWSCVANSGYVGIRQWQLHAAGSLASPNGNTRILSFSYLRNKPRWIVCHRFRTWLNQSRPWKLFFSSDSFGLNVRGPQCVPIARANSCVEYSRMTDLWQNFFKFLSFAIRLSLPNLNNLCSLTFYSSLLICFF